MKNQIVQYPGFIVRKFLFNAIASGPAPVPATFEAIPEKRSVSPIQTGNLGHPHTSIRPGKISFILRNRKCRKRVSSTAGTKHQAWQWWVIVKTTVRPTVSRVVHSKRPKVSCGLLIGTGDVTDSSLIMLGQNVSSD